MTVGYWEWKEIDISQLVDFAEKCAGNISDLYSEISNNIESYVSKPYSIEGISGLAYTEELSYAIFEELEKEVTYDI